MSKHYTISQLEDSLPSNIKRGDVVSVEELVYCHEELFMFDGKELVPFDEYNYIPEGFYVGDEFPLDYWKNSICHNDYVRIKTKDIKNIQLVIRSHDYIEHSDLLPNNIKVGFVPIDDVLYNDFKDDTILIETDGNVLYWNCTIVSYMEYLGYTCDVIGSDRLPYYIFNNGIHKLKFTEHEKNRYKYCA